MRHGVYGARGRPGARFPQTDADWARTCATGTSSIPSLAVRVSRRLMTSAAWRVRRSSLRSFRRRLGASTAAPCARRWTAPSAAPARPGTGALAFDLTTGSTLLRAQRRRAARSPPRSRSSTRPRPRCGASGRTARLHDERRRRRRGSAPTGGLRRRPLPRRRRRPDASSATAASRGSPRQVRDAGVRRVERLGRSATSRCFDRCAAARAPAAAYDSRHRAACSAR